MTTGYSRWDLRVPIKTANAPPRLIGRFASRSWLGGNSPKVKGELRLQENGYTCYIITGNAANIPYRFTAMGPIYGAVSSYDTCEFVTSPWVSNDDLDLWTKLADKIRNSDFNLAVFMAEGKEALDMISDRASRTASMMTAVSKKDVGLFNKLCGRKRKRSVKSFGKSMSDNWLEVNWGWLPLLNDVHAAFTYLRSITDSPPVVEYYAARRIKGGLPARNSTLLTYDKDLSTFTKKLRAHVPAPIPPYQSLGLDAPEQVAWERLPYSWALDYMLPVGDYLATVGLLSRVTGVTYWRTQFFSRCVVGCKQHPQSDRYFVTSDNGPDHMLKVIDYVRESVTPSTSLPTPRFRALGEMANWKRAANVLAVVGARKLAIRSNVAKYY